MSVGPFARLRMTKVGLNYIHGPTHLLAGSQDGLTPFGGQCRLRVCKVGRASVVRCRGGDRARPRNFRRGEPNSPGRGGWRPRKAGSHSHGKKLGVPLPLLRVTYLATPLLRLPMVANKLAIILSATVLLLGSCVSDVG
jgi:hypothetical protein